MLAALLHYSTSKNKGVDANSAQLSFMRTELYRFEVSI